MRRGTTPTITFTFPFSAENCTRIGIYFAQHKRVLVKKYETDCEIDGNTVSVMLTQAETLVFNDRESVDIQVKAVLPDGTSLVSDTYCTPCHEFIGNEVL